MKYITHHSLKKKTSSLCTSSLARIPHTTILTYLQYNNTWKRKKTQRVHAIEQLFPIRTRRDNNVAIVFLSVCMASSIVAAPFLIQIVQYHNNIPQQRAALASAFLKTAAACCVCGVEPARNQPKHI